MTMKATSLTMCMIFGAFALYAVCALGPQARLMPLLVAVPGLGFSALQLVLDLKSLISKSTTAPFLEVHQWRILLWIAACIPVIVLFGFDIATPVMVATYHRFIQRERHPITLLSTTIAWFLIAIVLDRFFSAQLFPGLMTPVVFTWLK